MKSNRKRTLTPEQEQAKQDRKARMRALVEEVSALSDEQRAKLASSGMIATVGDRGLSTFNLCLILNQNPAATLVGGFRQWIDKGRCVRKGEHGLSIWVPVGQKDSDGNITEKTGFVGGTVFDVSQTEPLEAK